MVSIISLNSKSEFTSFIGYCNSICITLKAIVLKLTIVILSGVIVEKLYQTGYKSFRTVPLAC